MSSEGCSDAKTASTLIVLEVGVQTKTDLPSPGVLLTQTAATRLTYAQLKRRSSPISLGSPVPAGSTSTM